MGLSVRAFKGHLRASGSILSEKVELTPRMVLKQSRSLHHPHDNLIVVKLQVPNYEGNHYY